MEAGAHRKAAQKPDQHTVVDEPVDRQTGPGPPGRRCRRKRSVRLQAFVHGYNLVPIAHCGDCAGQQRERCTKMQRVPEFLSMPKPFLVASILAVLLHRAFPAADVAYGVTSTPLAVLPISLCLRICAAAPACRPSWPVPMDRLDPLCGDAALLGRLCDRNPCSRSGQRMDALRVFWKGDSISMLQSGDLRG